MSGATCQHNYTPGKETAVGMSRIVVADDQEEMLETIASILKDTCELVGIATDGKIAIELVRQLSPDLLVLDISMPAGNGFETAFRLHALGSGVRVIFLTLYGDRDFLEAALSAGAFGYVLKSHLATDLIPAVRAALDGHPFISPLMLLH